MESTVGFSGKVGTKLIRVPKAPLSWRLRNSLRGRYIGGFLANRAAKVFSKVTGIPTLRSQLSARLVRADGSAIDYGVVGYKLVTTAFVEFMVDQLQAETSEWGDFKYHDSGVGVTGVGVGATGVAVGRTGVRGGTRGLVGVGVGDSEPISAQSLKPLVLMIMTTTLIFTRIMKLKQMNVMDYKLI